MYYEREKMYWLVMSHKRVSVINSELVFVWTVFYLVKRESNIRMSKYRLELMPTWYLYTNWFIEISIMNVLFCLNPVLEHPVNPFLKNHQFAKTNKNNIVKDFSSVLFCLQHYNKILQFSLSQRSHDKSYALDVIWIRRASFSVQL